MRAGSRRPTRPVLSRLERQTRAGSRRPTRPLLSRLERQTRARQDRPDRTPGITVLCIFSECNERLRRCCSAAVDSGPSPGRVSAFPSSGEGPGSTACSEGAHCCLSELGGRSRMTARSDRIPPTDVGEGAGKVRSSHAFPARRARNLRRCRFRRFRRAAAARGLRRARALHAQLGRRRGRLLHGSGRPAGRASRLRRSRHPAARRDVSRRSTAIASSSTSSTNSRPAARPIRTSPAIARSSSASVTSTRCASAPTGSPRVITRACRDGRLLRGLDPGKDQTYFLHTVPGAMLARTLFPDRRPAEGRSPQASRTNRRCPCTTSATAPASASSASVPSPNSSRTTCPRNPAPSRHPPDAGSALIAA